METGRLITMILSVFDGHPNRSSKFGEFYGTDCEFQKDGSTRWWRRRSGLPQKRWPILELKRFENMRFIYFRDPVRRNVRDERRLVNVAGKDR